MLEQLLRYLRNYFADETKSVEDTFVVSGGSIALAKVLDGQYFLIEGSVFNDGVHQYPTTELIDEEFNGVITPLKIPKEILMLAEEIEAWQEKYGSGSPYASESFDGYSYSKLSSSDGGAYTWKDEFASRLKGWKKL